jgi:hypothetical protein
MYANLPFGAKARLPCAVVLPKDADATELPSSVSAVSLASTDVGARNADPGASRNTSSWATGRAAVSNARTSNPSIEGMLADLGRRAFILGFNTETKAIHFFQENAIIKFS